MITYEQSYYNRKIISTVQEGICILVGAVIANLVLVFEVRVPIRTGEVECVMIALLIYK